MKSQVKKQVVVSQDLKERMSKLENKNSEAGFREQFEVEYGSKRKQKEKRKWEMKKLKRENPIAWHKKNIKPMEDQSAELQAYVQEHFDKQRQLLNHKGEKDFCGWGCPVNNQHVLS